MMKKRVVFMGTPIFAAKILKHLSHFPIDIVAVVTQADKKVGRKQILTPTPVKVVAQELGLPIFQPIKVKEILEDLQHLHIDYIITCAYGQFLPESILKCAKEDALNIHASLLPKYRGGAPIHWAIINGEKESGISLMRMIKAMDAGEVFAQTKVDILIDDTTEILHDKLIESAKLCLDEYLMKVIHHEITAHPQDESHVTFGYNVLPEDEHVSFDQDALHVHNHIRGLISWPIGYALLNDKRVKLYGSKLLHQKSDQPSGTILKIDDCGLHVATQTDNICITHVQVEGRKMYKVSDDKPYLSTFINQQFK
ncbi:MAG: methionyl-tRNA formyltransferase [Erysipelotrichia bacterium]|jgi:methionyl-tRNA formyltransferase|nr:methionyl-tRNA formyltransferase [Erysipelotrichia bacterium]